MQMPRPSLKAQRTEEILDAVERCVIRDGVNGATLERIGEEAGMQRSLLRHNVGNRETLIEAFLNRFFEKSNKEVFQMLEYLPKINRVSTLLDFLFDEKYANKKLSLVALALTTAAATNDSIRSQLSEWNNNFIYLIAEELQRSFSKNTSNECHVVAIGVVGIYFNSESMCSLGSSDNIRNGSKLAAHRLILSLDNQ